VTPILSRLYGPEAFGVAALFTSITGIIAVVVCMRYELSIVLPEADEEAANLLGASLLFAFLTSLLTIPIVLFGRPFLLRILKAPELGGVLWMVPPMVLVSGGFLGLNYWNSRTRQFGRLSVARVISSTATSAAQVGAGITGHASGASLVGTTVAGTALSTTVLGAQILRDNGTLFRRSIRWKAIAEGVIRHRKFPLFGTSSALLNAISWQLPTILLQVYFSSSVVGFYALGNRVMRVPMSLIGNAVGQVFFQQAAEAKRDGTLAITVENAFRQLVVFSLIPVVALTVVGPEAFVLVFGSRWVEAGYYAQILAPWTLFWFISSPLSTLFAVLEKQEFGLMLNAVILVSRFVSLAIGGRLQNARLGIILFSVSGVLVYGYYTLAILKVSGVQISKAARFLLSRILEYLPAIAILVALKAFRVEPWILIAVAVLLFVAHGIRAVTNDPAISALWRSAFTRRSAAGTAPE
jgi:O-antigen/teichoic acid export membrane protein